MILLGCDSLANELNFGMNHDPCAGSITQPADLQSSMLIYIRDHYNLRAHSDQKCSPFSIKCSLVICSSNCLLHLSTTWLHVTNSICSFWIYCHFSLILILVLGMNLLYWHTVYLRWKPKGEYWCYWLIDSYPVTSALFIYCGDLIW